jgi:hypothetical protein
MRHLRNFNESEDNSEINNLKMIMKTLYKLVEDEDYLAIDDFMSNYDEKSSISELRCILIPTKPIQNNVIIRDNRERIKKIIEDQIGPLA